MITDIDHALEDLQQEKARSKAEHQTTAQQRSSVLNNLHKKQARVMNAEHEQSNKGVDERSHEKSECGGER